MARPDTGQLLLVGVPGPDLDAHSAALYREIQPGGFILFGRNIQTATQLRKLVDDLRSLSHVEPIITIDQEGGRVSRLRLIGNEPPNAQQLRDRGDIGLIARHGSITASLLRLFGFNLDLCPVLDISFDDEADNSLRGRCYGRDVAETNRNAAAFNQALREGGITSCGKHFPGYSRAGLDAHHELPVIPLTRAELEEHELAVFRHFILNGQPPYGVPGAIDSMMICHAQYPELEPDGLPASLSHRIVTGILREELGYPFKIRYLWQTESLPRGPGGKFEDFICLAE